MEVIILSGPEAVAELATDVIVALLARQPDSVLGLATGSTPMQTYGRLVDRHRAGEVSFADTTAVLLDEYVGLPAGHAQSYRRFIERHFAELVDLPEASLHGPDGFDISVEAISTAGSRYEELLQRVGGVDLQILGIGSDGHIGFNEPGSSLGSRTRMKTLTDQTRRANARFFDDQLDAVPRHVLTQGVATILDARHLLLLATGASKAEPLAGAVEGPITAMLTASALQMHPHVTVIADDSAATSLQYGGYYRETYRHKPAWQSL